MSRKYDPFRDAFLGIGYPKSCPHVCPDFSTQEEYHLYLCYLHKRCRGCFAALQFISTYRFPEWYDRNTPTKMKSRYQELKKVRRRSREEKKARAGMMKLKTINEEIAKEKAAIRKLYWEIKMQRIRFAGEINRIERSIVGEAGNK
jgi:hypothetical protein